MRAGFRKPALKSTKTTKEDPKYRGFQQLLVRLKSMIFATTEMKLKVL